MKPSILKILTVVLVAFGFAFASAEIGSADPLASIAFAPLLGSANQAGLVQPAKCAVKDNKLVCDIPGQKRKKQDNDEDDQPPPKKGSKKEDTGLENCTIISKQGGGGCKTGFKFVCEKLKSGKKCCGCVEDKNAKKDEPKKDDAKDEKKETPAVKVWTCSGQGKPANQQGGTITATKQVSGNTSVDARAEFRAAFPGFIFEGPIDCTQTN